MSEADCLLCWSTAVAHSRCQEVCKSLFLKFNLAFFKDLRWGQSQQTRLTIYIRPILHTLKLLSFSHQGKVVSSSCSRSRQCRKYRMAVWVQLQFPAAVGLAAAVDRQHAGRDSPPGCSSAQRKCCPGCSLPGKGQSCCHWRLLPKGEKRFGCYTGKIHIKHDSWLSEFVFRLTANAICVLIRSTEEVWYGHQQRSHASQEGAAPNEPRPVDAASEKAHKNNENRVANLQKQTRVWKVKLLELIRRW